MTVTEILTCDVCGERIADGAGTVLLMSLHAPTGFAKRASIDLCPRHAASAWLAVQKAATGTES